uniref:Uncharacterized protein n=1 Tax=Gasterosteus aculeatus aculeatus TaxID=481459 RepID=A0AAQ4NYQ9_GASAC
MYLLHFPDVTRLLAEPGTPSMAVRTTMRETLYLKYCLLCRINEKMLRNTFKSPQQRWCARGHDMGDQRPPEFGSLQEELDYWKDLAARQQQRAEEAQEELQEFQLMSRDYELELEAQLKHCEAQNCELLSANSRLRMDLENYKAADVSVLLLVSRRRRLFRKTIVSQFIRPLLSHF